jgi:N-glycosylase/DNA lyase
MSLGKQDVVPIDTHIHSIAMTYYGQNNENTKKQQLTTANYDDISSFFEQLWKPCAGWAQAVSFILKGIYFLIFLLGGIF